MRNLKASIAFAFGYLFLYAGLAQGGAFALQPWAALGSQA